MSKTAYYHKSKKQADDHEIEFYLKDLAQSHKRWGFDKMMLKAKLDKKAWNHKRVYRIYCELGLNIRVKPRKRIPKGEAKILTQPIQANTCWSMDFMSDALSCDEVRALTRDWLTVYNEDRPHESLAGLPPIQFARRRQQQLVGKGKNSTFN